jgi:hypothetical protein
VIRPAAVVADRVLAELSSQGPSPEAEEESTPVVEEAGTTRNWNYSRKPKGEVGERLGGKIDKLLEEIRSPVEVEREDESAWTDDDADALKVERSTDALLEAIKAESLVVPRIEVAPLVGADEVAEVVVEEVAGAASTIATEPSPLNESAWGLLCDGIEDFSPGDLQELASALDSNSQLNAIALVASIGRAKSVLGGISPWTATDAPITIGAGDLVVLLRSALRGVG